MEKMLEHFLKFIKQFSEENIVGKELSNLIVNIQWTYNITHISTFLKNSIYFNKFGKH